MRAGASDDRVTPAAERTLGVPLQRQEVVLAGVPVAVWTASLDHLGTRAASLQPYLAPEERTRASEMRVETAARRFVGGRATLRVLLGASLDEEPSALRFVTGPHGKPALEQRSPGAELSFNVAHSGDLVAVAIARCPAVGVDLERRRRIGDLERLIVRALTPGERALFERWMAEGATALDAFLRAWTVKEARLKALGLPIGAGLSREHPEACALPWAPLEMLERADYFATVAVGPSRS